MAKDAILQRQLKIAYKILNNPEDRLAWKELDAATGIHQETENHRTKIVRYCTMIIPGKESSDDFCASVCYNCPLRYYIEGQHVAYLCDYNDGDWERRPETGEILRRILEFIAFVQLPREGEAEK